MAFQDVDPYTASSSTQVSVTASTSVTLDSYSIWQYRTSKYVVQATYQTFVYASEVLVTHDGTTVYFTEFGRLTNQANAAMASFTATLSNDLINFQFTNNTADTITVTATRLAINF
jgi:hypothetical protein